MFIVHFFISRKGRLGSVVLDHEAHQYSRDEVLEVLPADLQGRVLELRAAETFTIRNIIMGSMGRSGARGVSGIYRAARIVVHRVD
jgi:hypothetical protein